VQRIEADGYSEDAIGAVSVAKELMGIFSLNDKAEEN